MGMVGVMGGSFDPPHFGHLAIAEEARVALGLSQVIFVPAAQQPLKRGVHYATANQRLEMTRRAVATNTAFTLSEVELRRGGRSYTVDTLEDLRRGLSADSELFFILGADSLASFTAWRSAERILELTRLAVFERPGASLDIEDLSRRLPALPGRLVRLEGPLLALSSTAIRRRVADGRPIRYLVPDAVAAYITEHRLYRTDQ